MRSNFFCNSHISTVSTLRDFHIPTSGSYDSCCFCYNFEHGGDEHQPSCACLLWVHIFPLRLCSQRGRGIYMTRSGSIHGWDYSWSSGTVHQCPARPHLWAELYTWKLPALGKRNLSPFLHLIFSQKTVRLYTAMTSWHPEGCNALKACRSLL